MLIMTPTWLLIKTSFTTINIQKEKKIVYNYYENLEAYFQMESLQLLDWLVG